MHAECRRHAMARCGSREVGELDGGFNSSAASATLELAGPSQEVVSRRGIRRGVALAKSPCPRSAALGGGRGFRVKIRCVDMQDFSSGLWVGFTATSPKEFAVMHARGEALDFGADVPDTCVAGGDAVLWNGRECLSTNWNTGHLNEGDVVDVRISDRGEFRVCVNSHVVLSAQRVFVPFGRSLYPLVELHGTTQAVELLAASTADVVAVSSHANVAPPPPPFLDPSVMRTLPPPSMAATASGECQSQRSTGSATPSTPETRIQCTEGASLEFEDVDAGKALPGESHWQSKSWLSSSWLTADDHLRAPPVAHSFPERSGSSPAATPHDWVHGDSLPCSRSPCNDCGSVSVQPAAVAVTTSQKVPPVLTVSNSPRMPSGRLCEISGAGATSSTHLRSAQRSAARRSGSAVSRENRRSGQVAGNASPRPGGGGGGSNPCVGKEACLKPSGLIGACVDGAKVKDVNRLREDARIWGTVQRCLSKPREHTEGIRAVCLELASTRADRDGVETALQEAQRTSVLSTAEVRRRDQELRVLREELRQQSDKLQAARAAEQEQMKKTATAQAAKNQAQRRARQLQEQLQHAAAQQQQQQQQQPRRHQQTRQGDSGASMSGEIARRLADTLEFAERATRHGNVVDSQAMAHIQNFEEMLEAALQEVRLVTRGESCSGFQAGGGKCDSQHQAEVGCSGGVGGGSVAGDDHSRAPQRNVRESNGCVPASAHADSMQTAHSYRCSGDNAAAASSDSSLHARGRSLRTAVVACSGASQRDQAACRRPPRRPSSKSSTARMSSSARTAPAAATAVGPAAGAKDGLQKLCTSNGGGGGGGQANGPFSENWSVIEESTTCSSPCNMSAVVVTSSG